MTVSHRSARRSLDEKQATEWQVEVSARAARLPRGLRAIWLRITGQHRRIREDSEREAEETRLRHAREREALAQAQIELRQRLQSELRELRHMQAARLIELRKEALRHRDMIGRDHPVADATTLRKHFRGREQ